jgi:hypothetical protein
MKVKLKVWRQKNAATPGDSDLERRIDPNMSFSR